MSNCNTMTSTPTLQAIKYSRGHLDILDQLILPFESVYETIKTAHDGYNAIKTMKVRGAPAIAIVAALSLAVELHSETTHRSSAAFKTPQDAVDFISDRLTLLKTSRPTAVNLFEAADRLLRTVQDAATKAAKDLVDNPIAVIVKAYMDTAEAMLQQDIQDNMNIGRFGAQFIQDHAVKHQGSKVRVLTHCNTGSLATAGWGTALGIVRELHSRDKLDHAFCTETRPYNQGARLTAYELVYEQIPSTLVCDSMASALLREKSIAAIVVGADRVAANGDTANKIGTYQLAIIAKYHNALFIVAAPSTSIDLETQNGEAIEIEQRSALEVTHIRGKTLDDEANVKEHQFNESMTTTLIEIAARGIDIWNPAFDVTPASLISAIVTERGVILKKPGHDEFSIKEFLSTH
ncbi:S-methyl-5-thioribose-1-phosphate isomerase [Batrachochytrium dendrobatidis]